MATQKKQPLPASESRDIKGKGGHSNRRLVWSIIIYYPPIALPDFINGLHPVHDILIYLNFVWKTLNEFYS